MKNKTNSFLIKCSTFILMLLLSTSLVSAQTGTIADIASGDPNFSTLVTALNQAGLDTLLADPNAGPFTVFAPTNAAFVNATPGTITPETLADILGYHVVPGVYDSSAFPALTTLTASQGGTLSFEYGSDLMINGTATVGTADLVASNGVIHVIDSVLLPPVPTCADLLSDPNFSTLASAVDTVGLTTTLSDPTTGPFTIFAPTNEAFGNLPSGLLASLMMDANALANLLTYHVVEGTALSSTIAGTDRLDSLLGDVITVKTVTGTNLILILNENATIQQADIMASNCVVHVIDNVLIPITVLDYLASTGDFNVLLAALEAAGLTAEFGDPDTPAFTIFAPTDAAFDAFSDAELQALLNDPAALTDLLNYHVLSGELLQDDLTTQGTIVTANGKQMRVTLLDNGTLTLVSINDGAAVLAISDVQTANGVVHVIDTVLDPLGVTSVSVSQSMAVDGTTATIVVVLALFVTIGAATMQTRKTSDH